MAYFLDLKKSNFLNNFKMNSPWLLFTFNSYKLNKPNFESNVPQNDSPMSYFPKNTKISKFSFWQENAFSKNCLHTFLHFFKLDVIIFIKKRNSSKLITSLNYKMNIFIIK